MATLLRITHQNQDYIFKVLTDKPSLQSVLEISLGGQSYQFHRKGHEWIVEAPENEELNHDLLIAIGKVLALRFRSATSAPISHS